ncbi:MAG: alcohol dehydrogenase catalytic domain-containing protein [Proteobacteria bacterium]|nr:alcohol dehydrogenase catalytic domain-containing protein [Pseudomonadota bacterium]
MPEPTLEGDGEALVRPLAVARCELDPLLVSGLIPQRGPFALGHEGVAEIVALGDGVRGLEVGQRAVVAFQVSCGHCGTCGVGHSANCDAYPVLSDYGMQPLSGVEYGGFLSDLVRVPHAEAMLQPVPEGLDPVALASVSDNVLDGYRSVAGHLARAPGSDVLFVCHGGPSIALYGAQTALALGAGRVDFASDRPDVLTLAEKLGARPVETDFSRRQGRYPIVVDCGIRREGLHYALGSTAPEGVCQGVAYYPTPLVPVPLGKLYTLGIQFHIGRAHAVSLLPEVMPLVASGRLQPGAVTTRVADWEEAPAAYLEESIKLVVQRPA